MEARFLETAKACLANGDGLLADADMLSASPTSLALAILAEEEFAKGFLLFLVGQGVLPWNKAIWRATRDHSFKHLLSILMEYTDPDIEEIIASGKRSAARHAATMKLFDDMDSLPPLDSARNLADIKAAIDRRNDLWREVARLKKEQKREDALPPNVSDAINIFRHAKVGRWECGYAYDDEKHDPAMHALATGAKDRNKQRSLYVEVGKDGAVADHPIEVADREIKEAVERAEKIRMVLYGLIEHGSAGVEFDRLAENLKLMFASQEELRNLLSEKKD